LKIRQIFPERVPEEIRKKINKTKASGIKGRIYDTEHIFPTDNA
jgi:hypothetical protein